MVKIEKFFNKEYLFFVLGFAITLFNTVSMQQNIVLLLSIPQYLLVFCYILKKDYRAAFLFHAIFVTACVSGGIKIEDGVSPFLYIKMAVYGPLTLNRIILAILWIQVYRNVVKISKDSLLFNVRKIVLYFLVSGSVVGFFGCLLISHYDWHFFIVKFLFVIEVFLFVDVFVHIYSDEFSKLFAIIVVCMMAAAPIASVVSFYVFGIHSYYGSEMMPLYNPILALSPCLMIALFQLNNNKLRTIVLIGLVFYALHAMILSRGSQFLDIFVALILLAYLVYFKKGTNYQLKGLKVLLPVLLIAFLPFAINEIIMSSDVSSRKFEQFTSLFSIFDFSGNQVALQFDDIGRSPYIRVGELANIIHENKQNIFTLLFGKGFGGFYTDSLHFFDLIDLTNGAFSAEIVAGGRFFSAHSAIPSVLLYNGFIGLFFMFKIALSYLRRVDRSFLVFAAFVLFIQTFYFDMFGCLSFTMALFGTEYLINDSCNKTCNKII